MSEQSGNMANGPAAEVAPGPEDMSQSKYQPNGNGAGPPQHQAPYAATPSPRTPLQRIDSRTSLQYRPGYPVQPPRSPLIRPNLPPGVQPTPPFRAAAPGGARPPGQPPFPPRGPPNPNLRPATPFPRPQPPPVRPLVQQKSVPTFNQHPPDLSERSLTLDTADAAYGDDARHVQAENRHNVTPAQSRGYSLASASPADSMEERRRSITSIGSQEGRRSAAGSMENIDKRSEADQSSRPESRAGSRMGKIDEKIHEAMRQNVADYARPQSRTEEADHHQMINNHRESSRPQSRMEETAEHHQIQQDPPREPYGLERSRSSSKELLADKEPPRKSPEIATEKNEEATPRKSPVGKSASPVSVQKQLNAKSEETPRAKSPRVKSVKMLDAKPDVGHLDLRNVPHKKGKKDGDNDSGVDESTQGNDQSSNGDHNSPRKSASKTSRSSSMTPTKNNRSLSRDSKSPSLKSPDSNATTPGSVERKKLPMNKVQVGSAPSPNLKVVKSKIGSLQNTSYRPGGGNVKIESRKLDFKNAAPRIAAKNDKYAPKGGDKKIQQQKLQWTAKSKIGSLDNTSHKPKGGDKKIETVKLDFKEKAKPKVGSKDNIKHVPGGGDIKTMSVQQSEPSSSDIENKKIELNAASKVGSMDNMKHRAGGGEKKIFDDKEYLKQRSTISSERTSLSGSQETERERKTVVIHEVFNMREEKKHVLETVEEEAAHSRPASRLSRKGSARVKRSESARTPWRF